MPAPRLELTCKLDLHRLEEYRPWWARIRPTVHYLLEIEAHVFALAIAASVLLSFFPFLMVMLAIFRDALHWNGAVGAIYLAVRDVFPGNSGAVVVQNLQPWMVPHLNWTSMLLLLVTSNGIFEPLEVALNRIWGVTQNRSYWKNQVVSLGMVFACGAIVLLSLSLSALSAEWATSWLGHGTLAAWLTMLLTKLAAVPLTVLGLFLIYWLLPNRKIDAARVAPVAIWVGVVLEGLKYVNMVTRSLIASKLDREYHMFQYSVTILLGSFVAAMVVLAGAEWTARRDRVDPLAKE
ncbi:MAG: YihY/virulence factor BrkB family protein [Bryobacteraceae bacterium]